MLRYPTSEIKLTEKDIDNAERIQQQYLERKSRQQEFNAQEQQQQQQQHRQQQEHQEQESPSHDLSSPSFSYDSPERLDGTTTQEDPSTSSSSHTNVAESSLHQPKKGSKRPNIEPESSQRKVSAQEQRARITRQRLGIDQQPPKKND